LGRDRAPLRLQPGAAHGLLFGWDPHARRRVQRARGQRARL